MNTVNRIYYINLDRRADRNKHIKKELTKSKYLSSAERYVAIDGKKLDLKNLDTKFVTDTGKNIVKSNKINTWGIDLTYGSLGCALSHYNIYKECVIKSYEAILILEDDIEVSKNFDDIFRQSLSILDFTLFDILYFGSHNKLHVETYTPDNKIQKIKSSTYGAFAYLVTRRGCLNLINNVFPITKQFDSEISKNIKTKRLTCLITNPSTVTVIKKLGTDNQGKYGLLRKKDIATDPWESVFID